MVTRPGVHLASVLVLLVLTGNDVAASVCSQPQVRAEVGPADAEGRFKLTVLPTSQLTGSGFYVYWRGGKTLHYNVQLPYVLNLSQACLTSATELRVVPLTCWGDEYLPGSFVKPFEALSLNPDVSVEWVPGTGTTGELRIPYSFPNTTASSRWIRVYVDGVIKAETDSVNGPRLETASGVFKVTLNTSCWTTGSHAVKVIGDSCVQNHEVTPRETQRDVDRTTIDVDTTPVVAMSATEDADGNDTLSVEYSFPNTSSGSARRIDLSLDGAPHSSHTPTLAAGTWQVNLGAACWQKARAVAKACGRSDEKSTDTAELDATHNTPTVDVALFKSQDPSKGEYEAHIKYDLRENAATRYVKVQRLSWVDADGQEHPLSGPLATFATSGPLSGTEIVYLNRPADSRSRQLRVYVTARACVTAADVAFIDCGCDATEDPVYFADGNMRLSDTDPLPPVAGRVLTRTYDSDEQEVGLFGRGFTTIFSQRLLRDTVESGELVSVVTAANEIVTFEKSGTAYRQISPTVTRDTGTLTHDATAGTFHYRAAGMTEVAVFRATDGKLIALRDTATGREATIAYNAGFAETFTDSWTGVSWTLTTVNRRVTSIAISGRADLTWTYTYDSAGNLTAVFAPGGAAWRTYDYAANRMIASRDANGNLIESHSYNAAGYATDSTGPQDEIQNIQYNLPGTAPYERVTRVTMKTGAVTDYVLRPSGGGLRVMQAIGACAACGGGAGDTTYARDAHGRVVREQTPDGFITLSTWRGDRLLSDERYLQPAGCDPLTSANRCRLNTDELAAAVLAPTSATIRADYEYSDPKWPEKPTAISTQSVVVAAQFRREDFSYHPVSGALIQTIITGYAGVERSRARRGSTTTLYEQSGGRGDDGGSADGLAPAFDPGGAFQTVWLSLPEPALLRRSVDGPRTLVQDVTSFVYYPVHATVPALLRGRLAATRNAAGHITRFESYDVFGNATRVVDPNGVATETTYDILGRLKTSTVKAVAGCDLAADPLCGTDLATTLTYSPDAGPLAMEQRPGGGVTAYSYDTRGRVQTISRGPAASDLRERIEYTYDPLTGNKSVERILAFENGTWSEKKRESYVYNALGELVTVTHADGASVAYTYDRAGHLASTRDENHSSPNTHYTYDAAGRLSTVRQTLAGAPGGAITTRYGYDLHGNLVSVTDPNGNVTTFDYDDFGLMVRQVSPVTGATRYEYDSAGNLVVRTDARGGRTASAYDALGRIVRSDATLSGQTAETVIWSYDDPTAGRFAVSRPASMTDPAGKTEYHYDRRGLLREERRFFSKEAPAVPPPVDNGRDDGVTPGGGSPGDCGANGGRDCARTVGTLSEDRVESSFTPSHTAISKFTYDRDGNRSSIVYPSGKLTVTYSFDHAGRPLTATGFVTAARYLPFGPLAELQFANGTTQKLERDSRYRVTKNQLTINNAPASSALARYTYAYDPAGNITGIQDALDSEYHRHFGYDDLGRLVTANTGPNANPARPQGTALWGKGSYTWDAMGNMLSLKLGEIEPDSDPEPLRRPPKPPETAANVPNGRTSIFRYTATTPVVASVATNDVERGVTHDAAGNETSYFASRTYSPRNLLAQVVESSNFEDVVPHIAAYTYDGRGVRAIRAESPSNGAGTTVRRYYVYSPELRFLSVTLDDGPNVWEGTTGCNAPFGECIPGYANNAHYEIVWFDDRPVGQFNPGSPTPTRYTFADHLGTPVLQTSTTAATTWRVEHEPFGNVYAVRTGTRTDQPLRLPGQELASTWEGPEENYNVFRWYRGGWGRYTQADPAGLAAGLNLYAYALGNPNSLADPLGAEPKFPQFPPATTDNCSADEWKYCEGKCGSKSVVGCYVTITHKLKTVKGFPQFGIQRTVNCNCKEDDCEKSWPDKLSDWWKEFTDPYKPPLPPFVPIPSKLPTPKPVIPGLPPFFINPCYLNNYPGCGDPGIA